MPAPGAPLGKTVRRMKTAHSRESRSKSSTRGSRDCWQLNCLLLAILTGVAVISILFVSSMDDPIAKQITSSVLQPFIEKRSENTAVSSIITPVQQASSQKEAPSAAAKTAAVGAKAPRIHKTQSPPSAAQAQAPPVIPLMQPLPHGDLTWPNIHFIHIPKCGGTTMTAILRAMQCKRFPDKKHQDCCTNPGYCDWWAKQRCESIKGCTDHFPNRQHVYMEKKPSISLVREPVSRIISAWFYRGHSPNLDFFNVRPEFKEISQGKRPKVTFEEYMGMHEYHNIQTRMLGADSFPYRNITVNDEIFAKAVDTLNNLYFVGIQEDFDASVSVMLRDFNVSMDYTIKKERDMSNAGIAKAKAKLKNDPMIIKKLREINSYDMKLYDLAIKKFCESANKYPELVAVIRKKGKVPC